MAYTSLIYLFSQPVLSALVLYRVENGLGKFFLRSCLHLWKSAPGFRLLQTDAERRLLIPNPCLLYFGALMIRSAIFFTLKHMRISMIGRGGVCRIQTPIST
ncbi:hypothetical protein R3P38DRAFT_577307 [Favolaschia claudopus]|uniref:Secreted protein n=1 Tax=Favolaschia claudopus TaxID=2862362 RepID=A0AAV9Z927_9AGAR